MYQELLGGSGDISVVVEDSHASISGDMHLHGDLSAQISLDLCLLGWMHSWVESGSSFIEALISDFIDHLLLINIYYNL